MTESAADLPADLEEALRENKAALSAFNALSPSHKREYLKWILEAKKPETRCRRIEQTLERLTEKANPQ